MQIGSRIRSLRKEHGMTQEALAEQLGVSRQSISAWEKGQSVPSVENLQALAQVFGIGIDALLQTSAEKTAPIPAELPLPKFRAAKSAAFIPLLILCSLLLCLCTNSYYFLSVHPSWIPFAAAAFLLLNIVPGLFRRQIPTVRLRICNHGVQCLRLFLISAGLSLAAQITLAVYLLPASLSTWAWGLLMCIALESLLFWNGMICVYCTSFQLGLKLRVLGAVFGWVPFVNIWFLIKIIRTASQELSFEIGREQLERSREAAQICKTTYPLLLIHGVFFRDNSSFNYWGRIPAALQRNGATVYYGEHQSAASVADSAEELKERIRQIVAESGCKKVNIIAHSKGGLDIRCALNDESLRPLVASVTTINTPHRGCGFADYLLEKIPSSKQKAIEKSYNFLAKRFGDKSPDFMAAVHDLTSAFCRKFDEETPLPEGVFCQSVGSALNKATGGKFPLNLTYLLAKYFDGPNDGLVAQSSFSWGERFRFLTVEGKRGISHGDVIDLNRENIPDFDVREFYISLVSQLRELGF